MMLPWTFKGFTKANQIEHRSEKPRGQLHFSLLSSKSVGPTSKNINIIWKCGIMFHSPSELIQKLSQSLRHLQEIQKGDKYVTLKRSRTPSISKCPRKSHILGKQNKDLEWFLQAYTYKVIPYWLDHVAETVPASYTLPLQSVPDPFNNTVR